jgi:hypothetical protein
MGIGISIDKVKVIAHERRRAARANEFAPLDVKVTIPGEQEAAEAARQAVRQRYAEMQVVIDAATTVEEIKAVLPPA